MRFEWVIDRALPGAMVCTLAVGCLSWVGCSNASTNSKSPYAAERGPTSAGDSPSASATPVKFHATEVEIMKPGTRIQKSEAEWRAELTAEQFHVTREKGTERAFTGALWDNKAEGIYHCVCCGLPLFHSETKYKSGTGWPSFWQPIATENVAEEVDNSSVWGPRTEVLCPRCDAHLGHVFDDGPQPTGMRYCINSAALEFTESAAPDAAEGDGESDGGDGQE